MENRFKEKVAYIAGGSRGIGFKCAEMLAAGGANVVISGRNNDSLTAAIAKLRDHREAVGYQLDIADVAQIDSVVEKIVRDLGRIDILICSAGMNLAGPRKAEAVTEEEWDRIITVNLKGTYFLNRAVADISMIPRRSGAIVNLSSQAALAALPNCAPYAISKAGVNHLTRTLALEWAAYNIRVNAVAPTWTMTELVKPIFEGNPKMEEIEINKIPLRRFATVNDVADTVCYLASDAAAMITGITVPVDGGRTI